MISTYVCPSDSTVPNPIMDRAAQNNPPLALGLWYPASIGPTQMDSCFFCEVSTPSPGNYCCQGNNYGSDPGYGYPEGSSVGMFGRDAKPIVRFRDVTDGLANTWMVGESLPGDCVWMGAYSNNNPLSGTGTPLNVFESDGGSVSTVWGSWASDCGFKSWHPGGANFVTGDGSVHFVDEAINYQLYNQLGTRSGGEICHLPD